MTTIAVDPKYIHALNPLGDVNKMVDEAMRRYTIERIASEITRCRREVAQFEVAYEMTYEVFCDKISTEEGFTRSLREKHPIWEADLNAWEFYAEGLKEWLGQLENISKT